MFKLFEISKTMHLWRNRRKSIFLNIFKAKKNRKNIRNIFDQSELMRFFKILTLAPKLGSNESSWSTDLKTVFGLEI